MPAHDRTEDRDAILPAVRGLWRELAGDSEALAPGTVTVVRGSRGLCPPRWCAALRLGGACVIEAGEAPDETVERLLRLDDPTDVEQVGDAIGLRGFLGPAALGYLPGPSALAKAEPADATIREESAASLADWLSALPPDDVEESSVPEMERVVVAERAGEPVGAAGHLRWPTDVAHIGLIVAPEHRGQGLARTLGAAATRRALDSGLLPQWRARADNAPSRAVARRLGYVELGRQLAFLPAGTESGAPS